MPHGNPAAGCVQDDALAATAGLPGEAPARDNHLWIDTLTVAAGGSRRSLRSEATAQRTFLVTCNKIAGRLDTYELFCYTDKDLF